MYITPEKAAETVLNQLSSASRLVITGQIGAGKTTLARKVSTRLGLTHLAIDDFHGEPDPKRSAAEAMRAIDSGWVAEANVWQIPQAIWEVSDLVIFLDYANIFHYLRIMHRCFRTCLKEPSWMNIRRNLCDESLHMKIIFLYANENREGWHEQGGITNTPTKVIRCTSPRATNWLLTRIGTTS